MSRLVIPTLMLLVAATASAEARYNCAVLRTSDGFVALRDGAGTRHAITAKMRHQEMVHLLVNGSEDIVRSGDWIYVRWFPGTKRTAFTMPDGDEAKSKAGWVHYRLINCFEE